MSALRSVLRSRKVASVRKKMRLLDSKRKKLSGEYKRAVKTAFASLKRKSAKKRKK